MNAGFYFLFISKLFPSRSFRGKWAWKIKCCQVIKSCLKSVLSKYCRFQTIFLLPGDIYSLCPNNLLWSSQHVERRCQLWCGMPASFLISEYLLSVDCDDCCWSTLLATLLPRGFNVSMSLTSLFLFFLSPLINIAAKEIENIIVWFQKCPKAIMKE